MSVEEARSEVRRVQLATGGSWGGDRVELALDRLILEVRAAMHCYRASIPEDGGDIARCSGWLNSMCGPSPPDPSDWLCPSHAARAELATKKASPA